MNESACSRSRFICSLAPVFVNIIATAVCHSIICYVYHNFWCDVIAKQLLKCKETDFVPVFAISTINEKYYIHFIGKLEVCCELDKHY